MNSTASAPGRPSITVVITTCDRPGTAWRAVRSALAQGGVNVEVLVVDDGTTELFTAPGDQPELRVIRTTGREGVNRARNVGLAAAAAPWVVFLDDDDELLPDMAQTALQAAADSILPPPVSVILALEEVDADGSVTLVRRPVDMPKGSHYVLEDMPVAHRRGLAGYNALMAPTEVLRGIGGFDESIKAWMHLDLFLRLNLVCSIAAAPQVGYRMHHHGEERLSEKHQARAEGMALTFRKHQGAFRAHRSVAAAHLTRTGMTYLRAGRWGTSLWFTACGVARDPASPRALRQLLYAAAGPSFLRLYDRSKAAA